MSRSSQRSAQYKSGVVTLLQPDKRRVRVKFEDEDGIQSFWLRVVSRGSKGMRQTHMPAIGESAIPTRQRLVLGFGQRMGGPLDHPEGLAHPDRLVLEEGDVATHLRRWRGSRPLPARPGS